MEDKSRKDKNAELPEKAYELLSWAGKGTDVTVRDDQYEFPWLLDSVKLCRKKGARFRLIDSGKLDRFQLEWLGEAGADLYTSDEARAEASELERVNRACQKGGAFVAYFHHGSLESEEESSSISFFDLKDMGRSGIYFYMSNREMKREISKLNELAHACRKGGSWLVYYLHGLLENSLEDLARNETWIHISDQIFQEPEDPALVLDKLKSVVSAGAKLILHVEKGLDLSLLRDFIKTQAIVLFESSLFDYRSPFRALERKMRKRKLDFRAYYLYPTFLP
ncbi:MAG: hypothetical protein GTN73_04470 [Candidatus Aminicenantes bacterium]|nr:hypothetical protein [Candidatus Aminicenantes bacterium]